MEEKQGWRGRPARPAPWLALVLTSGQFCLVFKVVIQRKNGQMSKIGWNFKVGLALEKLPAPPLSLTFFSGLHRVKATYVQQF